MNKLFSNQSEMVRKLVKDGATIRNELTDSDAGLIHMIMGLSGETGELLDAVKKATIYRRDLDIENVIEELGDIEFYLEGLRQNLGVSRDEIINRNIEKLSKRYYKGSFTNDQAQERADKK